MVAPGSDVLDRAARAGSLARLAAADADNPLDVLVIGGGVVGCGSALTRRRGGFLLVLSRNTTSLPERRRAQADLPTVDFDTWSSASSRSSMRP